MAIVSNSVALLADAGHNLSDVLAAADRLGGRVRSPGNARRRATPMAARLHRSRRLFNAIILLVAIGGIAWEAIRRFAAPETGGRRDGDRRRRDRHRRQRRPTPCCSRRAARATSISAARFLHMAADAAVSAGVVAAGVAILLTGWLWLDPAVQPARRSDHRLVHLGTPARGHQHVAERGPRRHRAGGGAGIPGSSARRRPHPRFSRLADEHDGGRAHLPPGDGRTVIPATNSPCRQPRSSMTASASATATIQIEISADNSCVLEPDHVV